MRLLVCLLLLCGAVMCQRKIKFDYDWKFNPMVVMGCNTSNPFPEVLDGTRCMGLQNAGPKAGDSAAACEAACCESIDCGVWQFCPGKGAGCGNQSCWIGNVGTCFAEKGWVSKARTFAFPQNLTCYLPECKPGFDDKDWKTVNVPHDFVINGTFTKNGDVSHGYLPKGAGWYRKHFTIPGSAQDKYVTIVFDGVYRNSKVWLNGAPLGMHISGYTSFYFHIDNSTINWKGENVLSVFVDGFNNEGWWYEGGGIYRHVWLNILDPVHVAQWGVYVKSVPTGAILNVAESQGQMAEGALVTIETDVVNAHAKSSMITLISDVFNTNGKKVGTTNSSTTISAKSNATIEHTVSFSDVSLWSDKSPALYYIISTVHVGGAVVDSKTTRFGVRTVVFDVEKGLILNGQPVKIKGVCNHQDFAGVGVAMPERVNRFRVQKLQEMGTNGWRMSHNPPNPELLDMTDELGMLVWDENRNFDNATQFFTDQADMIRRDRNHPSVIMWSVCNEVGCWEQNPKGEQLGAEFKKIIQKYDTTRPVTAAMNFGWGIGLSHVLDVQGVNYNYGEYSVYHKSHPAQPMIGSETASCTCARGIYVTNNNETHKDIYSCDGCARDWWTAVQTNQYIAGGFAWTGFDYKGEPTPYQWPDVNSNFGIIDIAGFPKDTFYYYQSQWTAENVLHVFPHWNWPGQDGKDIQVWTYTNAAEVELFLNGKSLGKQTTPALGHNAWSVAYEPGTVQAIGYNKAGVQVSKDQVVTTGAAASLVIDIEEGPTLTADAQDTALIKVSVVDAKGNIVPTANNFIEFSVVGAGKVLGVGNGDPSCHEPDQGTSRSAFNGLARVLVQSSMTAGTITLTASSSGLASAKATITTKEATNNLFL